ncbi:shikimate kinase [Thermoactinospora rubra]|uniref:shikimate kinase n=1 Tax=Thermoactinospora rubra TaxID=1088767 RepID=UPI000A10A29F|nr:shikimate kinase [Thermoactinospora rubra]
MSKIKPVVVVGLMGSGKSTVANLLSRALGLPMSDSDDWLAGQYGATAAEMSRDVGVLHEREARHVLTELEGAPKVIAAAASVVEDPAVRQAMGEAFVVWLDAPDEVLAERMKSSAHRPSFAPATLRGRREPYFREVADLKVDVAANRPEQVVKIILAALEG